jgi:hypothetical protein
MNIYKKPYLSNVMIEPKWVSRARWWYKPSKQKNQKQMTSIRRGQYVISDFNRFLLEGGFYNKDKINVLIVGAGNEGMTAEPKVSIRCQYEAFNVAAYLEYLGLDYKITIIDIDSKTLEDLKKRQHIFVADSFLQDLEEEYAPEMNYRRSAWKNYLKVTEQRDNITHHPMEGLRVDPPESLDKLLGEGIHYAAVPETFRKKVADGDVQTINADITQINFEQKFDFILCCSVLYLIPKDGQKLAFYNLTTALDSSAAIYLHEPNPHKNDPIKVHPVMKEVGGWLTPKITKELGLFSYSTTPFYRQSYIFTTKELPF